MSRVKKYFEKMDIKKAIKEGVRNFLVGGVTLSGIAFLANNISPELTGYVTAFPIGLIGMVFIHGYDNVIKFTISHGIALIILVFSYVCFYLVYKIIKLSKLLSSLFSILFWVGTIMLLKKVFKFEI